MKASLVFFLLLILPLMLFCNTINQRKSLLPALSYDAQEPKPHYHNYQSGKELPVLNFNRDRSWRLERIIKENTDSGELGLSGIDSLYYANNTSIAIDSIANWDWYYWDNSWDLGSYMKYYYDTSGNYVTELDFGYFFNNTSRVEIKHCYYYDTENRLIHRNVFEYNSASQEFEVSSRTHYLYSGDVITNVLNYYAGMANHYENVSYTVDANGRIVTETSVQSTDSLTWTNNYIYTNTWDANDTSTGVQYAQYLAQYLPYYYMWDSIVFGMISEKDMLSYWTGSTYALHQRDVYSYNLSGFITEKVKQFANGSNWENGSRQVYTYDANNNVDQVYWQNWDAMSAMWDVIFNRNSYVWGQTTANNDDVIIPVPFSVSVYPNPFSDKTSIEIRKPDLKPCKIGIYNVKGQLVRTLYLSGESNTLIWDGKDRQNNPVKKGLYLIKSDNESFQAIQKCIKLK